MIDRKKIAGELLQTAHDVLSEIKKLEPSDSEICASFTSSQKVVYENKDFSLSSSHQSKSFGLRTITGGKLGFMTSNHLDPKEYRAFAKEAQLMASLSPSSPHNQISAVANEGYFELYDDQLASATPRELMQWGQTIVDEARQDKRVSIDRSEISLSTTIWAVANSKGISVSAAQTSCDWFIMGMAKTDDEVTSFDYDGSTVSEKSKIDEEIKTSIARFRNSVISSLEAKKGEHYSGAVLLHPYAVLDLIGDVIGANCSGTAHADGVSPWKGRIGEKVVSEMLEAFEDPTDRTRLSGWSPFDREGVRTQKHTLISSGVLNFIAHNTFSASRMGTQTTGNAVGGSASLPKVGFHNFAVTGSGKAKLLSDSDLKRQLDHGLLLKRFSGNSDAYSGEFSGVAKNSTWIKGGVDSHPVQEVMVAGNIFEIMKSVAAVGKINHALMGNSLAPYILLEGINVTAG